MKKSSNTRLRQEILHTIPKRKSVSEETEDQESTAAWLRERRNHLFSKAFKEGIKNQQ